MLKQQVTLKIRNDPAGLGHYGAPRLNRKHRGIDFVCEPGEEVLSPIDGVVTRHGYCYQGDDRWRYIEVTSKLDQLRHRLFYCTPQDGIHIPKVAVGEYAGKGKPIGYAQDITEKYPDQGMLPHIHVEIKNQAGEYIDPGEYGYV